MPATTTTPEALLQRLEWTVLRRLDGLLHGDYRTLFRGYGVGERSLALEAGLAAGARPSFPAVARC